MLRIFFDTEFTELTADAKLISIGFIDETGDRIFYAELSDTWVPDEVGDFARQAVLPLLGNAASRITKQELGKRLALWLASFDGPVKLATDSLNWDWRWIRDVFREHGAWPSNLDEEPLLLSMNTLCEFDEFEATLEHAFASGLRRHHALDDAKANRLGWIASGGDIDTE